MAEHPDCSKRFKIRRLAMDTNLMALEQSPVKSPQDQVSDSQVHVELGANAPEVAPLKDRKAPRAEPEEDVEILEAQNETLQDNQTLRKPDIENVTKSEIQDSSLDSLEPIVATEDMGTQKVFPPPCPALTAESNEESLDDVAFSSPEGEAANSPSNSETISDTMEGLLSPDSLNSEEQPPMTPFTDPSSKDMGSTSDEMTDDNTTGEGSILNLNISQDGSDDSEPANVPVVAAAGLSSLTDNSPSEKNISVDSYTLFSPPFADESEEEKEVSVGTLTCQQQESKQSISSQTDSAKVSLPTTNLPAVTNAKLREVLLSHIQRELALRAANQEAAQQVLSQATPPLSTVAMEPTNKGGAASSLGCVVAERETHSRVGERTDGESKQIEGEKGQIESGLERNKVAEKQQSGGLFSKRVQTRKPKLKRYRFVSSKQTRMESDSCDDSQSDSGVSTDFSPCSTLDGNTTVSTGGPVAEVKETPIEREIRRSIEREQSLRRSRGLPKQVTSPEYVEIPLKKTVLFQTSTTNSDKCQGKDRQFAGKKMQHEIHEEVQREQDLVKLGKVPGFYHKGTVRQLKERKRLFEVFQAPTISTLPLPSRTRARSWPFSSDISNLVTQDAHTVRGSYVEKSPNSSKVGGPSSPAPQGPGFSEGTGCQVIIIESSLSVPAQNCYHQAKAESSSTVEFGISCNRTGGHRVIEEDEQEKEEEEQEEDLTPRENPFFKLRSSTNLPIVEQDIREAQQREKELLQQRMALYGGGGGARGGAGRLVSTERNNLALTRSSSLNRLPVTDPSGSVCRPARGPPAARQSVGKLGMWPPAQAQEGKINRPEFLHSPRKKTPLVQRWEAGLINSHNQEED